jgi:hypothetical protein
LHHTLPRPQNQPQINKHNHRQPTTHKKPTTHNYNNPKQAFYKYWWTQPVDSKTRERVLFEILQGPLDGKAVAIISPTSEWPFAFRFQGGGRWVEGVS